MSSEQETAAIPRSLDEEEVKELGELDFAELSAEDWEEILREHPVRLTVRDPKGTHAFEYDHDEEYVTFYAFGSAGYDEAGSRNALEEVANQSDGIALEFFEEVSA